MRAVAVEADALIVVRAAGDRVQRFRAAAPLVLCVQAPPLAARAEAGAGRGDMTDDGDEAAHAAGRRMKKRARTVPTIEEVELADLGVESRAVAPRRTSAGKLRQVRGKGGASLATSPEELIARLRADRLLGRGPSGASS